MTIRYYAFLSLIFFAFNLSAQQPKPIPQKYKLIYSEGFNSPKCLNTINFSNPEEWLVSRNGNSGKALKFSGKGQYTGKNNTPSILAIIKDLQLQDFILEIKIVQEGKDFSLRDFCFFWGYEDSLNYTFAKITSENKTKENNIFVVNNSEPFAIGEPTNKGIIWGYNKWHTVTIERSTHDTTVNVYFDDQLMIQSVHDKNKIGLIGFGSSDDAGKVDDLKIWAPNK